MKAAVYYETGAPEVLRYEDVPDPEVTPGTVLIEVEAISIEGGDTLNRAGGEMATVPHIVGYQCAGTISEVGEGVTDRKVGAARRRDRLLGFARREGRGAVDHHLADSRRRRHRRSARASRSRSAPPTIASSSSAG